MTAPAATDPADAAACDPLLAALPATLRAGPGELERRPLEGAAGAAWGDPPVVLVCPAVVPERLSEPLQLGRTPQTLVVFTVRDDGDGQEYTTLDRSVPVSVRVPDAYDATLLVPLTEALRALPEVAPRVE